jgi:opacity protein-like surface antigen
MKKRWGIWLIVALAVLLALPTAAQAEMYGEVYLGGVQGVDTPVNRNFLGTTPEKWSNFDWSDRISVSFSNSGQLKPAVQGGIKLGTWFVREGTLGFDYPGWMKYFGFYLDFKVHRLVYGRNTGSGACTASGNDLGHIQSVRYTVSDTRSFTGTSTFTSEGLAPTVAIMFAGRYGLLPDAEVPFGRLQPYLAVGPGIMFINQSTKIGFLGSNSLTQKITSPRGPVTTISNAPVNVSAEDSEHTVAVCLAVDAGVRYMALKNVSVDLFFNYRFARPTISATFADPVTGDSHSVSGSQTYHLLSGNLGVAYHF